MLFSPPAEALPALKDLDVLVQVRAKVDELYVEPVDLERMDLGALKGLLMGYDRYNGLLDANQTYPYEPPADAGEIGLIIGADADSFKVVGVKPQSPAAQAGIAPGDRIVAIGNLDFYERQVSVYDAQAATFGSVGSQATIAVYRESHGSIDEVPVTLRQVPPQPAVATDEPEPGVLRLKVGPLTGAESLTALREAVTQALAAAPKALILDLRWASEGDARLGVRVADLFLADGKDLGRSTGWVSERTAAGQWEAIDLNRSYRSADGSAWPKGVKLVVLVGEGTAEAGEVAAGLLQAVGKVPVLGAATAGKVTFFTCSPIAPDNRYRMLILSGSYRLPGAEGTLLHGAGVKPDQALDVPPPKLKVKSETSEDAGQGLLEILSKAKKRDLDAALDQTLQYLREGPPKVTPKPETPPSDREASSRLWPERENPEAPPVA